MRNLFITISAFTAAIAASTATDIEKEQFLNINTPAQRKNSLVSAAYPDITNGINADIQKVNLVSALTETVSCAAVVSDRIINRNFNAAIDKQYFCYQPADRKELMEEQFIPVINTATDQHAEQDKNNLLIPLAKKYALTKKTKADYLVAAKKIDNGAGYGTAD